MFTSETANAARLKGYIKKYLKSNSAQAAADKRWRKEKLKERQQIHADIDDDSESFDEYANQLDALMTRQVNGKEIIVNSESIREMFGRNQVRNAHEPPPENLVVDGTKQSRVLAAHYSGYRMKSFRLFADDDAHDSWTVMFGNRGGGQAGREILDHKPWKELLSTVVPNQKEMSNNPCNCAECLERSAALKAKKSKSIYGIRRRQLRSNHRSAKTSSQYKAKNIRGTKMLAAAMKKNKI